MSDLNLYSVNWQDGMLVTQQHLRDQEKYLENLARWYALDVGDRFGLVRKSLSGKTALSMNASVSSNRLRVELTRCQAVTPDGSIIEINESNQSAVKAEMGVEKNVVPVYVGIGTGARKEVGDPDPHEDLPRVPYLVGPFMLTLGQPPNLPEGRFLQVAELTIDGNDVTPSETYYPPCLALSADERLTKKTIEFHTRLENLLSLSSRAYAAITAGGVLSGESSDLQRAFRETIYQFAIHMSASLDDFIVGKNASHPVYLVVFFKRLARVFTTLLNLQPGLKDWLNERYFVKEISSDIGRFTSMVEAFLLTPYDHCGLGAHISAIDEVLGQVRGVLGFLAQVKKDQLASQAMATDTLMYRGMTLRLVEYSASRLEQVGELSYLQIDIPEPRAIGDTVVLITKDLFSSAEWAAMQVRLGLNEARGLGETDPVEIDTVTYGNKVALHPQDMLSTSAVRQMTLIFRGGGDQAKFSGLGKMDLIMYAL